MLPLRDPTTIFACLPGCLPTSPQPVSTLLFKNPPVTPFRTESPASCETEISQCNSSQVSKVPIAIRATDYLRFCLSNSHTFEAYTERRTKVQIQLLNRVRFTSAAELYVSFQDIRQDDSIVDDSRPFGRKFEYQISKITHTEETLFSTILGFVGRIVERSFVALC